jgi:hypothetical protein
VSSSSHAGLLGPASHLRFEKTSGLLLAILLSVPVAWLIVRGWGLAAVGGFALTVFYFIILARWQRGVYGLLVYLPFSGAVALALYPWNGPEALNPVLYKDWLFALPAYAGFFGACILRRTPWPRLGRLPSALLLGLTLLVGVQMANPGVPSMMVALIGAKVWLFYLPLYVLAAAMITTRRELIVLLRLLVVLAVIPCVVGIVEYLLAQMLEYRSVMEAIYGVAAQTATQEFTVREIGSGLIERIPSTFTFVAQYFGFTLAMIVPCYALGRMDSSSRWRRFAQGMLMIAVLAGLLSGARAAFVFVPLLLALMYTLDRGIAGLFRVGMYSAGVLAAGFAVSWVTAVALYEHVSDLFTFYARGTAYNLLIEAITTTPLGNGTGTNTGPARYAFNRPELFNPIENYYAKATYELGIPGLLLVLAIFGALILTGLKAHRRIAEPGLRSCSAALIAFLIAVTLYNFKGWIIDLDPFNVYFWVFAGIAVRLPGVEIGERSRQLRHSAVDDGATYASAEPENIARREGR